MGLILMIIAALVVAIILAVVIVKFLPLKLRWIASVVLLAIAVLLVVKIYGGVMKPINFNKNKKVKFAKVIQNLKIIRDAELAYKEVTGSYTKDKALLISFIDTAQRALIETRDTVVKVNKGSKWQPVMIDVEQKITDTIAYEPILKDFEGKDYKNMFNVPGVEGKQFELDINMVEKLPGLEVPVFEAKTDKAAILVGMDRSLIKQEMEAVASDQIKGEFVSVGSLYEVTTGGNWPPFYDKQDRAKENKK
jgi:hypothetical protein